MAKFIDAGRRAINPDHIIFIEQVRAPDAEGRNRSIRIDMTDGNHHYFSGDEITDELAALLDGDKTEQASEKDDERYA